MKNIKKTLGIFAVASVILLPSLALADVCTGIDPVTGLRTPANCTVGGGYAQNNLVNITTTIGSIINLLVPIVMTLLVVTFFYGLAKYVLSAGDPEKAAEGKSIMIYGALAMFVGLSIWGIVSYLNNFFATSNQGAQQNIQVPKVSIPLPTT